MIAVPSVAPIVSGGHSTWWSALIAGSIGIVPMLVCWALAIRDERRR